MTPSCSSRSHTPTASVDVALATSSHHSTSSVSSTQSANDASEHHDNQSNPEEALESHEVLELNAFIERKAWIEEKIQFLEKLPPIEVFVGMEDIHKPMDQISGLATRAQLDEWLVEHDRIEKETEIFDSGDLKKLKKFTKACTQRNLSPEDTDLIELTLTTLYALDKLLHLLRNRSENLDLLHLRLSWEEHRAQAYESRRTIVDELHTFLTTRARWSSLVYISPAASTVPNSVAFKPRSMSTTSIDSTEAPELHSRGLRFRLQEELSKDALQLSSKITSLKHGPVAATGKLLDKLIENSRRPVPEPMLDEQDRVEEKCANELDTVGRFLMVVMSQWRKADEIYNETKKDISVLKRLREELENANSQHPSRRMEMNYSSRAETVAKRIAARMNPASPRGTFPLPVHPLFPDQAEFNTTLVRSLSAEIAEATDSLNDVNAAVESYRSRCKAIEDAEQLREEMTSTVRQICTLKDRFENGFQSDDGDGSPPDLSLTDCLEPLRFSSYLAMLPGLLEEAMKLEVESRALLGKYAVIILRLQSPGINPEFKEELASVRLRLETEGHILAQSKDTTTSNVAKLRDVRRIWATLADLVKQVEALTTQTREAIGRERWKQHFTREELPPTPEGSLMDLPVDEISPTTMGTLDTLYGNFSEGCERPFENMRESIPQNLSQHLESKLDDFRGAFSDLKDMCVLLVAVQRQAASMSSIRDDMHGLLAKIDELRSSSEELSRDILQGATTEALAREQSFIESLSALDVESKEFEASLLSRVVFLTRERHHTAGDHGNHMSTSKLPFNSAVQDRIVRHDANTFAVSLSGAMRDLRQRQQYVHACSLARVVDLAVKEVENEIDQTSTFVDKYRRRLKDIYSSTEESTSSLQELKNDIESTSDASSRIEEAYKKACADFLALSHYAKGVTDDACQLLSSSRSSSLDRVKERLNQTRSGLETVKAELNSFELSLARIAAERSSTSLQRAQAIGADDAGSDYGFGDDTLVQETLAEDEFGPVDGNVLDGLQEGPNDVNPPEPARLATPSSSASEQSHEAILSRIQGIRDNLRLLALETYCNTHSHSRRGQLPLPSESGYGSVKAAFTNIESDIASLPSTSSSQDVIRELAKLNQVVNLARTQLKRIENLALLSTSIAACDVAFSDLLNHVDSYPSLPESNKASSSSALLESPEEMLSARLATTKNAVSDLSEHYAVVADDSRASAEYSRLMQTWEELSDMAMDCINGRPMSRQADSSGRNSSVSAASMQSTNVKRGKYATLTHSSKTLFPPVMQRRTVSNSSSNQGQGTQPQRPSKPPSNRAVSGPIVQSTSASSLFKSTFASRQRTNSTTSNVSPGSSKPTPTSSKQGRRGSLTSSSIDHSSVSGAKSTSRGTWSRAPRQSFGFDRPRTPQNKSAPVNKKRYIANPSNKLDVAVGDVVNSLPVNIDIEVVADTWKDQSGKYWIGGEDPKLCFCRILRSQTVMVRVGGGWSELSKFIQDHYADLFRLLPESPPQAGSREAKWINASTLREAAENERLGSMSPRTPEPAVPSLPSFAFSSPDGANTSMRSESSFGSPLTPLQFIRRAGNEPSEISLSAHSRASSVRPSRKSSLGMSSKPAKLGVWRP